MWGAARFTIQAIMMSTATKPLRYLWVMSHTSTSHVADIDESCHSQSEIFYSGHHDVDCYQSSEVSMSHVTHVDESCRRCG